MDDLIQKIKHLGFTEYESKVFLAILQGSLMSASEIADDAGIRRTDVYNILKSFVEKGYCNEIETNSVMKYEMIDPVIVIGKIERRILKSKEEELTHLRGTLKDILPLYRTKESEKSKVVNVELIRGYNQHRVAKFMELFKSSKEEILFMVKLEHQVTDDIDETAKAFFAKGGVIRSIYETNSVFKVKKENTWTHGNLEDLINVVSKFESYGEDVKLSTSRLPNITIFDREIVFMNINDKTIPRHNEADIIIRNKEFALNMIQVFESFWASSQKVAEFKNNLFKEDIKKD